jgi:hypothetical protein
LTIIVKTNCKNYYKRTLLLLLLLLSPLMHLYGKDKSAIHINVPFTQKQTNGTDCGLFAIAFITSYCFRKTKCFDLIFDATKLRSHLLHCFETGVISEFPFTDKTISKRNQDQMHTITIDLHCLCYMPECLENMVQCVKCDTWCHYSCVNAPADISQISSDFECGSC